MRGIGRSAGALTFLAALVLVLFTPDAARGAGASGGTPEVPLDSIEGYLDEVPEGAEIVDRVKITRDGKTTRQLLVVDYRESAKTSLITELSKKSDLPFDVEGTEAQLDRLFGAEAGARVDGVFQRHGGTPRLLIQSLEAPKAAPHDAAS